jgi:hypothetical protein
MTFGAALCWGLLEMKCPLPGDIYSTSRSCESPGDSQADIKILRKNKLGVDLLTAIELPDNDRDHKKTRTKFYTPAYEEWEAKYMPQPETVPAT